MEEILKARAINPGWVQGSERRRSKVSSILHSVPLPTHTDFWEGFLGKFRHVFKELLSFYLFIYLFFNIEIVLTMLGVCC